jgi:IS5 family transposase
MAVDGNLYDGHTLKPQLDQVKELTGGRARKANVDRGYRVKPGLHGIDIVMPNNLKKEGYYLKRKREERCRSRAGIEGLISHLKHDHRMLRNYLCGTNQ